MPLPTIAVAVLPADYNTFVDLIGQDADFPATYEEWQEANEKYDAQSRARGEVVRQVIVQPQDLLDYCQSTGQKPSLAMLQITAVYLANKHT